MIKEGKVGVSEAVWLVTVSITAKVFYTSPSVLAGIVGNNSWYVTLISTLTALVGFMFIYLLLKRFQGKDLIQIYDIVYGRVLGFFISAFLALFFIYILVVQICEFHQIIKVYVFPHSPNWFMVGMFVLSILIVSLRGLESITRIARISIFFLLSAYAIVLGLGAENYDINYLFPFFGHGIDKALINGLLRSSAYIEVILLAVFAGSFQGIKHIKKAGILGLILSGIIISVSLLAFDLTYPYTTSKQITSGIYELSTLIDYGRFLQRVEPIFLFIWIISTYISSAAVFYCLVKVFCTAFRINDKKPVIMAGALLVFILVLLITDISTVIFSLVQKVRSFGWIPIFAIPVITLIIAIIRKKGRKKCENQSL